MLLNQAGRRPLIWSRSECTVRGSQVADMKFQLLLLLQDLPTGPSGPLMPLTLTVLQPFC